MWKASLAGLWNVSRVSPWHIICANVAKMLHIWQTLISITLSSGLTVFYHHRKLGCKKKVLAVRAFSAICHACQHSERHAWAGSDSAIEQIAQDMPFTLLTCTQHTLEHHSVKAISVLERSQGRDVFVTQCLSCSPGCSSWLTQREQ